MKHRILIPALAALLFSAGPFIVQKAEALTLIPPSTETAVDPGVSFDTTIKLYNETQDTLVLYADTANFTAEGETGKPAYDLDTPITGAAAWFELPDGAITLAPGERIVVPVTINPPSDAEPGGHYVLVTFGTTPTTATEGGEVTLGQAVGSLFLLRVFGDVQESGSIVEFSADPTAMNRLPVSFMTRFENAGNIHLRPTGAITLTNMLGRDVTTVDVNTEGRAVLPDSIRRYDSVWEKGEVKDADGNAIAATEDSHASDGNLWSSFWTELGNEWRNFAFGRYKATVALTAGSGGLITDTATLTLWVIPWRVLTIFIVGLVILVLLVIVGIKRYNAWILSKAGGVK